MSQRKTAFENQVAAAAALGVSVDIIRAAKNAGCPAFRSGRIYREPLTEWLKRSPDPDQFRDEPGEPGKPSQVALERAGKIRELELKCEQREIAIAEKNNQLVKRALMEAGLGQMLIGIRAGLNSLPPNAARWIVDLTDFHQIREALQTEVDALIHGIFDLRFFDEITPATCERISSESAKPFATIEGAGVARETLFDLIRLAIDTAFMIVGERVAPKIVPGLPPDTTKPASAIAIEAASSAPVSKKSRKRRGSSKRVRKATQ